MVERDDDGLDPFLRRIVDAARQPVEPDPAARARLEEALRREARPGRLRRALDWLLQPRPVRVSPLGGLAMASVVILLAVGLGLRAGRGARDQTAHFGPPPQAGERQVQFVLVAPDARTVSLVGDFNDWRPGATPLRAAGRDGVWTVEVPLEAGRYTYSFVVDGRVWKSDPEAPAAPEDDFGRPSSVILVGDVRL